MVNVVIVVSIEVILGGQGAPSVANTKGRLSDRCSVAADARGRCASDLFFFILIFALSTTSKPLGS
jgi:hypothetical protein